MTIVSNSMLVNNNAHGLLKPSKGFQQEILFHYVYLCPT